MKDLSIQNRVLSFEIDGICVKVGLLLKTSYSISIKIMEPYEGFVTGRHIFYLARSRKNYNGKYGDETIESLASELYYFSKYVDENMVAICDAYKIYRDIFELESKNFFTVEEYQGE